MLGILFTYFHFIHIHIHTTYDYINTRHMRLSLPLHLVIIQPILQFYNFSLIFPLHHFNHACLTYHCVALRSVPFRYVTLRSIAYLYVVPLLCSFNPTLNVFPLLLSINVFVYTLNCSSDSIAWESGLLSYCHGYTNR